MDKVAFLAKIFATVEANEQSSATCFAPTNIALIKYWGKRDQAINLPMTNSLSLTLPDFGTTTTLSFNEQGYDQLILNDQLLPTSDPAAHRVSQFLEIFRPYTKRYYQINTVNNIPTAAGLASSASGFAALTLALDKLHGWGLSQQTLSIFARLGSGSACRSLWNGFVVWQMGKRCDGADSYGEPLADAWPELCFGLILVDSQQKRLSSRQAMQQTIQSAILYRNWPAQVAADLAQMTQAIRRKHFDTIGQIAEENALTMHATMMSARPPIVYSTSQTWKAIEQVWQLRCQGIPVYFTQDAGPNIKLLFLRSHYEQLMQEFPTMQVQLFA